MTNSETTTVVPADPLNSIEWIRENSRWLIAGAAIVIIGGGGWWIYNSSRIKRETNAATALFQAKQSVAAGNPALAQSDLQKLVSRYSGTAAGAEGALLLAQLDYNQSKFQEGITALEQAAGSAPQPLASELRALMGDGYMSIKNPAAAAKEYQTAADLADFEMDRASKLAQAARAYAVAGDTAKARQMWTDLSTNRDNPAVAAEAKVRAGELSAKPIGAS
jgi:predicted negative regulator of RcsB-dependent stress response